MQPHALLFFLRCFIKVEEKEKNGWNKPAFADVKSMMIKGVKLCKKNKAKCK